LRRIQWEYTYLHLVARHGIPYAQHQYALRLLKQERADEAVYWLERAREAGLILVDTKYEFGRAPDGSVLLIDEVHTPDSSRYWKADSYGQRLAAGLEPESFDKEFVRLAYARLGSRGDGPMPAVPDSLWEETSLLYRSAYEQLTGTAFEPGDYPVGPRLERNLRAAGLLR